MGNLFSINSPLWNAVNKLLHFLWLSLLWALCCVPIITMGASTTALYSVCLKYAENEEGYLTSSFFHAFKQNFKQATMIWIAFMVLGTVLGVDFITYFRSDREGALAFFLTMVFFSIFAAFLLSGLFVFALQAKFNNTVFRTMLNSVLMAVRHWPSSLTMLFISLGILLLGFLAFPPVLFFAPALISYSNSRLLVKIFDQYIN